MLRYSFLWLLLFLCLAASTLQAQSDSAQIAQKRLDSLKSLHSPSRAALYSAVLPGLGQIYNKKNKYWKVPIIYATGATMGYFIALNNRYYLGFRDSYYAKLENRPQDDPYPYASLERVKVQKNYSQRNRDFLIIISLGLYGLNVLDAFVEGHLKSFNVDDDLSLRITPYTENTFGQNLSGFSFKLNFR